MSGGRALLLFSCNAETVVSIVFVCAPIVSREKAFERAIAGAVPTYLAITKGEDQESLLAIYPF